MAKTYTVLPATATITAGQPYCGSVRVQNGDASAVRVATIRVYVTKSGGGNPGHQAVTVVQPPMPSAGGGAQGTGFLAGQGVTVVPETSGDVYFPFSVTAHSPLTGSNVDVILNATVTLSDGTTAQATTATLTVRPPVT